MYGGMVDIQSATAENRRGKKKEEEEEITALKYNICICYGGGLEEKTKPQLKNIMACLIGRP